MGRTSRSGGAVAVLIAVLFGINLTSERAIGQSTWTQADIGSSKTTGTASISGSSVTLSAAGNDIGGTADKFFFAYQAIDGDVEIRARLDDLSARSSTAQAGVMIRGALTRDAAHASTLYEPAAGTAFVRRAQTGASTATTWGSSAPAPVWLRVVRTGTTFTSYSSLDGSAWVQIGQETVSLGTTAYVGLAVSSQSPRATATAAFSQVTITRNNLPAGQQAADIGAPSITGSTTFANGSYQMHAGGSDIGGGSDQFQYLYQSVTGDADVTVRIASQTNSSALAKAGVMFRAALDPKAANVALLTTPSSGYLFQRRAAAGDTTASSSGGTGTAPVWLRIKRTGSLFTAYRSTDGTTWTTISSDSIAMADPIYVGIAAASHSTTLASDVTADNFSVAAAQAADLPPSITLTAPANGASFTAPASITISATASDPENQLSRVDFYNGTTLLGSDTTAPYSFAWSNVAAGTYSLSAMAYDASGQRTQSAVASVTVSAGNQAPTVSLTAPANGASFVAPASITIGANASDPENQLTRVDFYNGSTLLGSDATAPYTFTWSSVPTGSYSLTARAYDAGGLNTQSAAVSVSVGAASGLPSGQQAADIGAPAIAGSTTYSGGTYQIRAGGTDIWDTADQFHFVYQQATGDTDVRVRVDSMTFSASWAKAGVMIRNTLAAGSIHAYAALSADQGVVFNRRLVANGTSVATSGSMRVAPGWVRLTRSGDLFTAYESGDGQTWTPIASQSITMASTVYVGIAVTSQNPTTATTVAASALSITQGTPANQPPSVSLTAPANGASFTAPASITISATASDPENQLSRVDFYQGSTLLGSDTTAPYSFAWSNVAAGTYSLSAMAYDASGQRTQSAVASVTVSAGNQAPTVSLTAPANGASFVAPASITISANAADPENQLTRVDFYNGSTLLGSDTTAPYAFGWSNVPAGTYSLSAVARDAAGLSTQSVAVSVTVTAATTAPTGVIFQASADHATVTSYRVEVFAAGADPNTATAIATTNVGKPTPDANNDISVSIPSFFQGLAPGNYQLTVAALNGSGFTRSNPPVAFTR